MSRMKGVLALSVLMAILGASASPAADWPQWGGVNNRNMISQEKGLPDSFEADKDKALNQGKGGEKARNVPGSAVSPTAIQPSLTAGYSSAPTCERCEAIRGSSSPGAD